MRDLPLTARPPFEGRRVVLGITGGLAAYKSVQLARDLALLGAQVETILTRSAERFVGPLSFSGVTGGDVHRGWEASSGSPAIHLRLAETAHLVLVAPATADLIARAAHGRADDLLAAVLLATRAPVVLAPAMNTRMYEHPQTEANVAHCRDTLGYRIAGPGAGPLGAGEGAGTGRMLEPGELVDHAGRALATGSPFEGRSVLVTAGPTREAIDPVRFLGNRSSGRMGFAIAREAWLRGADVTLVTGPSELPDPTGVRTVRVETAMEMLEAVRAPIAASDFTFFAAAVSDFRPSDPRESKIKRGNGAGPPTLELEENPDIAAETRPDRRAGAVAIGFALETSDLEEGAVSKLEKKGFDLVVGNRADEPDAGFDAPTNRVTLFFREGGREELPLQSKEDVARALLDRVAARSSSDR